MNQQAPAEDRQRILALLTEPTLGKAAERAGVGERTLRRWLAEDAAFQAQLAAAKTATFEAAMHRVQALTTPAVEKLDALLGAETHRTVRLGWPISFWCLHFRV